MTMETYPDVLNLREAASLLRIHPMTLYKLVRKHAIPCRKVGGTWRLNRQEVMAWLTNS